MATESYSASTTGVTTDQKTTPICWAHAIAMVIYQTKKNRPNNQSTPEQTKKYIIDMMRDDIMEIVGVKCAPYHVDQALEKVRDKYEIYSMEIGLNQAKSNLQHNRYVLATYRTTQTQWNNFNRFFYNDKKGILDKDDINHNFNDKEGFDIGHAVVLVATHGKTNPPCLLFKNSWGKGWGDEGKFRIKDASVLPNLKFYEVGDVSGFMDVDDDGDSHDDGDYDDDEFYFDANNEDYDFYYYSGLKANERGEGKEMGEGKGSEYGEGNKSGEENKRGESEGNGKEEH